MSEKGKIRSKKLEQQWEEIVQGDLLMTLASEVMSWPQMMAWSVRAAST